MDIAVGDGTVYSVPNIVEAAVPFFLLSIAIEVVFGVWKGKKLYRVNDSISDLTAGFFQQILGRLFCNFLAIVPYAYVYHYAHLLTLPDDSWITEFLCFFLTDFAFYWFHRAVHEMNFGWATHTVHHSSEDFNYAVALRQGVLQNVLSWISNLWLALFFSPIMYAKHAQLNLIYQFLIHTKTVPKLGWLEHVLNTPSHHRVHHARNPQYLDKNYGGILIVFDKWFGTFEEEREECVYGLVHPLETFDPVAIQMHHWEDIGKAVAAVRDPCTKVQVVVRSPAWDPLTGSYYSCPQPDPNMSPVFNPHISPRWLVFALVSFAFGVGIGLPVLNFPGLTPLQVVLKGAYMIWCFTTVACILNNRHLLSKESHGDSEDESSKSRGSISIVLWFELARLALTAALPSFMITSGLPSEPYSMAVSLYSVVVFCWLSYLIFYQHPTAGTAALPVTISLNGAAAVDSHTALPMSPLSKSSPLTPSSSSSISSDKSSMLFLPELKDESSRV